MPRLLLWGEAADCVLRWEVVSKAAPLRVLFHGWISKEATVKWDCHSGGGCLAPGAGLGSRDATHCTRRAGQVGASSGRPSLPDPILEGGRGPRGPSSVPTLSSCASCRPWLPGRGRNGLSGHEGAGCLFSRPLPSHSGDKDNGISLSLPWGSSDAKVPDAGVSVRASPHGAPGRGHTVGESTGGRRNGLTKQLMGC